MSIKLLEILGATLGKKLLQRKEVLNLPTDRCLHPPGRCQHDEVAQGSYVLRVAEAKRIIPMFP